MKVIGHLPKQPKYQIKQYADLGFHTGWEGEDARIYTPEEKYGNKRVRDVAEEWSYIPIILMQIALLSWERGRSSAVFTWRDTSNNFIYKTAMQTSFEMFKETTGGYLTGQFTFIKQGSQYSLTQYRAKP